MNSQAKFRALLNCSRDSDCAPGATAHPFITQLLVKPFKEDHEWQHMNVTKGNSTSPGNKQTTPVGNRQETVTAELAWLLPHLFSSSLLHSLSLEMVYFSFLDLLSASPQGTVPFTFCSSLKEFYFPWLAVTISFGN